MSFQSLTGRHLKRYDHQTEQLINEHERTPSDIKQEDAHLAVFATLSRMTERRLEGS
jgi:hypothetical protein